MIRICTRHSNFEKQPLLLNRHVFQKALLKKTSQGHRAKSSVFWLAMEVDMAVPDEERDVLNTTSFELLEMTPEQTEVGSRDWLDRFTMFVLGVD